MTREMEGSDDLVLGVDIGGSKIALGAVDPSGRITVLHRHPTGGHREPEAIIDDLVGHIQALQEELDTPPRGIGVGICGLVSADSGVVRHSPNLPRWADVPIKDRLQERLEFPVTVANDVEAVALGEWSQTAGRGIDDLAVVFIGTGVGGGIVSGGRPLRGHLGYAAEVGHTTIVVDGRECHCGNLGCLEAYVGGWAIARRTREAVKRDPGGGAHLVEMASGLEAIEAETVARAYGTGDGLAKRIVEETGHYLGAGLVGIVNSFNPQRLVLGGGVMDGIPQLLEIARKHVHAFALPGSTAELEMAAAELGAEAGVIGGAVLARKALEAGVED